MRAANNCVRGAEKAQEISEQDMNERKKSGECMAKDVETTK